MSHQEVQQYIRNLASHDDNVRETAVVALGEIANESIDGRNLVLQAGAMQALLSQFNEKSTLSMVRKATLTLSRFCRRVPHLDFELVRLAMPFLAVLIYNPDPEVVTDACWTLNYISDGPDQYKQAIIDAEIIPQLLVQLRHGIKDIQTPALLTIAGLTNGNDSQTQCVVDSNALPCLSRLLASPYAAIRKTSCLAISNVTAGNVQQIQAVIDCHIILPLIQLLSSAEFPVRKEAAFAICNAIDGGNQQQILSIVNEGCIHPLCNLLTVADEQIVMMALKSLEKVLMIGDEPSRQHMKAAQGLSKIEKLQLHPSKAIYKKAYDMLQMYLKGEVNEVEQDHNFMGDVEVEDTVMEPFQDERRH